MKVVQSTITVLLDTRSDEEIQLLNALPIGAEVLDADGDSWEKNSEGEWYFGTSYQGDSYYFLHGYGPLKVRLEGTLEDFDLSPYIDPSDLPLIVRPVTQEDISYVESSILGGQ